MKVNELMIGNYVKCQGHIYIVEEISAKGWVHLIHPETKVRVNMTSDYIIDLLEPIPLTDKILEKNGFGYFEDANEYILLTNDLNSVVLTLNGLTVIFHWHDIPIMCVHQLQRVLRLCGLNELADNFKVED